MAMMKRREMIAAAVAGVVTACGSRAAVAEPARHWMSCMVCGKRLTQCEDILGRISVDEVGYVRTCKAHSHLLLSVATRMAEEWWGAPVARCSTVNCKRFRPVSELEKRGGICPWCMWKTDREKERAIWRGIDIDAGEGVVYPKGAA